MSPGTCFLNSPDSKVFRTGENKNGRNHPTSRLLMVTENNKDVYMQWQYWYISYKNATNLKKKTDSQNSISIFSMLLFYVTSIFISDFYLFLATNTIDIQTSKPAPGMAVFPPVPRGNRSKARRHSKQRRSKPWKEAPRDRPNSIGSSIHNTWRWDIADLGSGGVGVVGGEVWGLEILRKGDFFQSNEVFQASF